MAARGRAAKAAAGEVSGATTAAPVQRTRIEIPLNRVEGDLEISVEIEDGVVSDAWATGTMFRGFERMLVGRGALDGLVITPRICGICSTSHLLAAATALDRIAQVTPPPDAVRVRNVLALTEHIQSDLRQGFITFAADFTSAAYEGQDLFADAVRRYAPFRGETVIDVIRETRQLLEIVALLAGQWPHSSSMVPGGIVSTPSSADLLQCRVLVSAFRAWYERRILGCKLERWAELRSAKDLDAWLRESASHRESDLGTFIRLARRWGLDKTGRGTEQFLSFGGFDLPSGSRVTSLGSGGQLLPAGLATLGSTEAFDEGLVAEEVAASWYEDDEGGRHPRDGVTEPYASGREGSRYSWSKAPRYGDRVVETGPLAELLVAGDPLVRDMVARDGVSTFVRQLARVARPTRLIPALQAWLEEIDPSGRFYESPGPMPDGEAAGLVEAARGALGHWVRIEDRRIAHYQIIPPTTWNASPRDGQARPGAVEQALIGTPVRDVDNPVEVGHVVRSFDPCLVCTVHGLDLRGGRASVRVAG